MKRSASHKVKQAKKTLGSRKGQNEHEHPSAWASEHVDNKACEAQRQLRKSVLNARQMRKKDLFVLRNGFRLECLENEPLIASFYWYQLHRFGCF